VSSKTEFRADVLAEAAAAIEAAKAAGDISEHGYGELIPGKHCAYRTGMCVSDPHFNVDEVATSLLYLVGGPAKILRSVPRSGALSSYYLKHQAEHWGELVGFSPYVSNGAFIVAAEWLGVPSRRREGSPNIGYGLKLLRAVDHQFFDKYYREQRAGSRRLLMTLASPPPLRAA
jgi:hypothetical protein